MPSCANAGRYAEHEVISAFLDIEQAQTVPEFPKRIAAWWETSLGLAKVKYVKNTDTYEITFPNFGGEYEEIWGIDMKSSRIWPINSGALLSAIVLFCHDQNDQRLDCQLWFRQVDALKQSTKNKP